MALPRINETLNFTMTIPSTGQKVKYRPYLVKEEKVLLQAFESGDTKTCLEAMADTLAACIDANENVDVSSLATFDVEYMFVKVRSQSVGETSRVQIKCAECQTPNTVVIPLDEVEIDVKKDDAVIPITDNISVEMRYPTYRTLMENDLSADTENMDTAMSVLASSVAAVLTDEERIDAAEQTTSELVEFLSSMTTTQLQSLSDFLEKMPALRHEIEFTCEECQHENKLELKGLSDFF
jgi:nucleoid DNA-binding protein